MRLPKRFLLISLLLILSSPLSFAEEEVLLEPEGLIRDESILDENEAPLFDPQSQEKTNDNEENDIPDISKPQELNYEHSKFYNAISKTAKDFYELEIDNTRIPSCLFKKQLTKTFEKGPVESVHFWNGLQMSVNTEISEEGSSGTKYKVGLINTFFDGKFRGGKENFRIMLDTTPQHDRSFMSHLFQDVYVDTRRIKNNRLLIGNSRPGVGYEGAGSSYIMPFASRSQIARNFGTVRKLGVRLIGNYKYADYDVGGYSSQTYFTEFFPGAEVNSWVTFKPLANLDSKKYGSLKIGGGIATGKRNSTDFFVQSTYLGYEYKNFRIKAEYANADGSNGGSGLTDKKRQGWTVTLYYLINKKLEAVLRYDEFDPDKKISNNNIREYSAGLNFYIKGQALKLILNYVFCQNQNAPDSHRIILGTQIAL